MDELRKILKDGAQSSSHALPAVVALLKTSNDKSLIREICAEDLGVIELISKVLQESDDPSLLASSLIIWQYTASVSDEEFERTMRDMNI